MKLIFDIFAQATQMKIELKPKHYSWLYFHLNRKNSTKVKQYLLKLININVNIIICIFN